MKRVYTRKPSQDIEWSGGNQGKPVQKEAPKGHIFAVIVSPNSKHANLYPEVAYWINSWAWIEEETGLSEAPIGWVDRYCKKLWTRE